MEISEQKKLLRQEIRKKRKLLTQEDIQRDSAKALIQLLQTPEYFSCHSVFVYVSYQQELSTFPVIEAAFLDGKSVAVPKVISEREMEFFKIKEITELNPGFSGILEPDGSQEMVYPDKNSLMVLPGMLFDRTGKRIGYGGGFYDNYLKKCRQQKMFPVLAGYTYDFQLFERENISEQAFGDGNFPAEEHDQCVDMLITPGKVIYTDNVRK